MSLTLDTNRQHLNVSGYRFVELSDLEPLRDSLRQQLNDLGVKGTILLAEEGINVALSGTERQISEARQVLNAVPALKDLWLKESYSRILAFSKMKVRIRPEIITFDPQTRFSDKQRAAAPSIPPTQVKQWLDEGHEFTLLDTRNRYEVASGTFATAVNLDLEHFRDFAASVDQAIEAGTINTDLPVVTFCTGGIRCEKAAPFMKERGFKEVYQIEGGVLNYFEQCQSAHWQGDCFVFDDRVEIDANLAPTDAYICRRCHLAFDDGDSCGCSEGPLIDPHMNR
ncbi:MAG: sulfurtransferase [Gammaproteobacteria bacterium]|nr:sulfurtransferase [Gammaproteobacteria bacterium]